MASHDLGNFFGYFFHFIQQRGVPFVSLVLWQTRYSVGYASVEPAEKIACVTVLHIKHDFLQASKHLRP